MTVSSQVSSYQSVVRGSRHPLNYTSFLRDTLRAAVALREYFGVLVGAGIRRPILRLDVLVILPLHSSVHPVEYWLVLDASLRVPLIHKAAGSC